MVQVSQGADYFEMDCVNVLGGQREHTYLVPHMFHSSALPAYATLSDSRINVLVQEQPEILCGDSHSGCLDALYCVMLPCENLSEYMTLVRYLTFRRIY